MIRIRFLLTNFLKSHQQWRNKQIVYQETTNNMTNNSINLVRKQTLLSLVEAYTF
jgi:hypothetical protein